MYDQNDTLWAFVFCLTVGAYICAFCWSRHVSNRIAKQLELLDGRFVRLAKEIGKMKFEIDKLKGEKK